YEAADDTHDVLEEVDDGGEDRAHLDHRGEAGHRGVVELHAEYLLGDGQVAGGGDRQPLGHALHDPQQVRLPQRQATPGGTHRGEGGEQDQAQFEVPDDQTGGGQPVAPLGVLLDLLLRRVPEDD